MEARTAIIIDLQTWKTARRRRSFAAIRPETADALQRAAARKLAEAMKEPAGQRDGAPGGRAGNGATLSPPSRANREQE